MRIYSTSSAHVSTTRTEGFYPSRVSARYLSCRFVWLFGSKETPTTREILHSYKEWEDSSSKWELSNEVTAAVREAVSQAFIITRYFIGEANASVLVEQTFTPAETQALKEFLAWISIDDDLESLSHRRAYVACNLNEGRTLVVTSRRDESTDEHLVRRFGHL